MRVRADRVIAQKGDERCAGRAAGQVAGRVDEGHERESENISSCLD